MRFMFERKSYMNRIFLKLFVSLNRILDEKGNVSMIQSQMEHFFREYYGVCYSAEFNLVKNHEDAEDVAQEVLIRLLIYRPELANKEHEKAWMIRTAINLAKDLLKSKWHKTTVAIEEVPTEERGYFQLPHMETDDTLWVLLELPQKYKECLYLFYYEDYSIREIAGVLEKPENTIKTNLRRGRELLKERLKEGN